MSIDEKPLPVDGKPCSADGKPFSVDEKPFSIDGKPFSVDGKPLPGAAENEAETAGIKRSDQNGIMIMVCVRQIF